MADRRDELVRAHRGGPALRRRDGIDLALRDADPADHPGEDHRGQSGLRDELDIVDLAENRRRVAAIPVRCLQGADQPAQFRRGEALRTQLMADRGLPAFVGAEELPGEAQ